MEQILFHQVLIESEATIADHIVTHLLNSCTFLDDRYLKAIYDPHLISMKDRAVYRNHFNLGTFDTE